jgi:structure-specific recognition protein 1
MPSVFNNLRLEGAGRQGSLQIAGDGAAYTCRSGRSDGKVTAVKGVKRATWTVFGKYANVVLLDGDDGVLMRLDGFTAKNKEALRTDLQSIGVKLEDLEFCSSGANRGKHFFEAQGKRFVVEQTEPETEGKEPKTKRLFDLDLSRVSQCVVPTNTRAGAVPKEVSIQFNEDRREGAAEHQLVELRLYVPPGSGRDGDEENEDESDALRIQQQITQAANLKSVTGSLLAEFAPSEGVFVLPRGRYAVEMYADFFRMHGNMYDYKIAYSDVERFILLPRTDDVHYAFIVALDRPIRQGQQRYPHLVWQLKKTEAEIMVKLTEEQITSKYGANCGLKPELSGALYQLVARVFKVLSGKKVFTTGKFRSSDGRHAVSCSVKASTGQLYPLERSLAFIHKPTLIIKFEDISAVEFERFTGYGQSSATKNFDLKISTRGLSRRPL